jgi:aminocarboxymuconate-semialdehyde decarboxylase
VRERLPGEPMQAARRMFYDNLVYDSDAIHHLVRVFGDGQVMVGTDYPFSIMDNDPAGRLDGLDLPADVVQRLRSGNARRWLGLEAGQ